MIVAGLGCRKGASADAIEAALVAALDRAGIDRSRVSALATHDTKHDEPGLVALAVRWGLPLISVTTAEMSGASEHVETHSDRVIALKGVPSVAEAAALAAAGPDARLLAPRTTTPEAACALAEGGEKDAAP